MAKPDLTRDSVTVRVCVESSARIRSDDLALLHKRISRACSSDTSRHPHSYTIVGNTLLNSSLSPEHCVTLLSPERSDVHTILVKRHYFRVSRLAQVCQVEHGRTLKYDPIPKRPSLTPAQTETVPFWLSELPLKLSD